jgi:hypothetical protein
MYHSMSLVELKQVAKTRRIKMYYTKKRVELIRLLSMPELPDSFKIEKLTILQLREQAKERGMRGFWKLSRDELVKVLYPTGELSGQVDEESKVSYDADDNESQQSNQNSQVRV